MEILFQTKSIRSIRSGKEIRTARTPRFIYSCTVVTIFSDTVDTELNGKNVCDSSDVESLETQWYHPNLPITGLDHCYNVPGIHVPAVTLTTDGWTSRYTASYVTAENLDIES